MALPILTSEEDVQKVVDYFKTKATGATIEEAKPILGKFLDPRKLNGYITWKILKKEGDRYKLDEYGRQLSRTGLEGKKNTYSQIIRGIKAYHSCLEWAFHKNYDTITNIEVAAFWHEHLSQEIGSTKEATIKDIAICFFYICQAADLGKLTIGRKGQSTRLNLNLTVLGQYIGETGIAQIEPHVTGANETESETDEKVNEIFTTDRDLKQSLNSRNELQETRIFISHSDNMEIVEQIKTMLDLANLEYEVAVDEETTAIPVPEKVLAAMRKSTAAIICVTADEKEKTADGKYFINQNVLIEIGSAFVLYDKKVVLVWDKRLDVPSNLQGLYRCEFQGEELTWSAGMKLMKAVNHFKK